MSKKAFSNVPLGLSAGITKDEIKVQIDEIVQSFIDIGMTRVRFTGDYDGVAENILYTSTSRTLSGNSLANATIASSSQTLASFAFAFNDSLQSTKPIFIKIEIINSNGTSIDYGYHIGSAISVGNAISTTTGDVTFNGASVTKFYSLFGASVLSGLPMVKTIGKSYMNYTGNFLGVSYGNMTLTSWGSMKTAMINIFIERTSNGFFVCGNRSAYPSNVNTTTLTSVTIAKSRNHVFGTTNVTYGDYDYSTPYHSSMDADTAGQSILLTYASTPTPERVKCLIGSKIGIFSTGNIVSLQDSGTASVDYVSLNDTPLRLTDYGNVVPMMYWGD